MPHPSVWSVSDWGALLALELLAQQPPRLQRIVLWQPVVGDEQMLTQFLRVLAVGGGNKATSSAALRTRLAAGEALAIAGYDISPGNGRVAGPGADQPVSDAHAMREAGP